MQEPRGLEVVMNGIVVVLECLRHAFLSGEKQNGELTQWRTFTAHWADLQSVTAHIRPLEKMTIRMKANGY